MYTNSFFSTIIFVVILFLIISISIQLLPYVLIAYVIYQLYKFIKRKFFKEPRKDGGIDIEDDVVFYDETHRTDSMKQAKVIDVD